VNIEDKINEIEINEDLIPGEIGDIVDEILVYKSEE
jgi:hypothetical protein